MAALHDALKTLGPADFTETPLDDLKSFLSQAFSKAQLLVDSVPIPAPAEESSSTGRSRANTTTSIASSASEISLSSARASPPPADVEVLQKEWKSVKLHAKENPLGMYVYKLGAKDGNGAWFARRSVHEGLGFTKWKKALENEFPESLKVQGGPGEGNIRGIGGERRVEFKNVDGAGKLEVYLLSAQFPGPTTPRDFVTMLLTSDQALSDQSGGQNEIPRHFMVISKPCIHPDAMPRDGYIRGTYESVEFIREIPRRPKKSASSPNLAHHTRNQSSTLGKEAILRNASKQSSNESEQASAPESAAETAGEGGPGRARGKTISLDKTEGSDNEEANKEVDDEENPVEWIMITRSDPGGSVPRFMVERGTPGSIVADASKFLNWACAKDIEDFDDGDEPQPEESQNQEDQEQKAREQHHKHNHEHDLHSYQTNGHLAGLEEEQTNSDTIPEKSNENGGVLGLVAGAVGAAGAIIAAHTPQVISDHLPGTATNGTETRRSSISSVSSDSTVGSFASALENNETSSPHTLSKEDALKDKELLKLEEKKAKLDARLKATRERELSKKSEDTAKEEEALRKAEEKHAKEVQKAEEKHKREVEKLEQKKLKEEKKAEERRRKAADKDDKVRLLRELEEVHAELDVLRKEKTLMLEQIGALQVENSALATKAGRVSLAEVRDEVAKAGRVRANSLKALTRSPTNRTSGSLDRDKENTGSIAPSTGS